jgi:hypothetical protein
MIYLLSAFGVSAGGKWSVHYTQIEKNQLGTSGETIHKKHKNTEPTK